ncbi:hypothetical protein ACSBR1_035654 [Camellia fascicularis]
MENNSNSLIMLLLLLVEVDGLERSIEDNARLLKEHTPSLGTEFESKEIAYQFYNEYGRIMGFSIRRDYHTKSKKDGIMVNRKFVCCKQGEKDKRSEMVVTKFDDTHNHIMHLSQCAHIMPSQRKVSEAQGINMELADAAGLSLKASHDLISTQAGGREFVGFTREDQKSYLCVKRQRYLQYGEAGTLLSYFHKQAANNPYVYYAVQLDVDEMITNIFWADHQMIIDYEIFGDAISFDTTFRTNKEYRPFALFTGFNHFRMTVVFGATLLYDETTSSFEWLFEIFLHAMPEKKPSTIFTD